MKCARQTSSGILRGIQKDLPTIPRSSGISGARPLDGRARETSRGPPVLGLEPVRSQLEAKDQVKADFLFLPAIFLIQ